MNSPALIGLVNNAALLLALGLLYDMVEYRSRGGKFSFQQIILGIALGAIGIAVMMTPWELSPGLIFDTRSVLLSISGLFFGTLPTIIAVMVTAALRFSIGGSGVLPGIAIIVTSGGIGIAWRHLYKRQLDDISVKELYILGLIVHFSMLLWMLTLPWPLSLNVLSQISAPVMLIHPVVTALLGWLMVNRRKRKKTENALQYSEHQLKLVTDNLPAFVAYVGMDDLVYRFVNSKFVESYKLPRNKIIGSHIRDVIGQENYKFAEKYIDIVRQGKPVSYENRFLTAGTERWIHVNYVPDINKDGEVEAIVVLSYDITERKKMEETLGESEGLLRAIAENYPHSYLSVIEKDFSVGYTAGQEFKKRNLNPDDYVGLTMEQVFGEHAALVTEYYQKTFDGEEQSFEMFFSGQHQRYSTVPFYAKDGSISRILVVVENITKQKEAELVVREANEQLRVQLDKITGLQMALQEQALRDPLTGLFNRRYMESILLQELAKAQRKKKSLSVVMLDLDNLKEINDLFGHAAGGDRALQALADSIQALCRTGDTFCRYAGDEFIVILSDTSLDTAYERTLEWRDTVTKIEIVCEDGVFGITFSAGISEYPSQSLTENELIRNADKALYQAKKLGRNRVVVCEITEK